MDVRRWLVLAALLSPLMGCGVGGTSDSAAHAGVTGAVLLGPQCPVENVDRPCEDQPAANVEVTVSEQLPGESYTAGPVVARGRTRADGTYRIEVGPGDYVVTAVAGMSCELMDARVTTGFTTVDVPCDTGIR